MQFLFMFWKLRMLCEDFFDTTPRLFYQRKEWGGILYIWKSHQFSLSQSVCCTPSPTSSNVPLTALFLCSFPHSFSHIYSVCLSVSGTLCFSSSCMLQLFAPAVNSFPKWSWKQDTENFGDLMYNIFICVYMGHFPIYYMLMPHYRTESSQ